MTTPAGVAAHQRDEQRRHAEALMKGHEAQQRRAAELGQFDASAGRAMLMALGSCFFSCFPVSIVALSRGLRVRAEAKRLGAPVPTRASVAIALGALGSVVPLVFLVFGLIVSHQQQEETDRRVAALEAASEAPRQAGALDHRTACSLAEAHVLRNGWDKRRGYTLDRFTCEGKLSLRGEERAALEELRFKARSAEKPHYAVHVCFERGARWHVSDVRWGPCDLDAPGGTRPAGSGEP